MPTDLSAVHPDLRSGFRQIPRFTLNRWNRRLIRQLFFLAPRQKIAPGVQIEQTRIPAPEADRKIALRIYRPDALTPPAPGLLWIHGGGYVIGAVEMVDGHLSRLARALRIPILSVDYRLAPEHPFPAPLDDCYTALQWVHAHATELGIDPRRIAIGGESAGGGLAASLAQLAQDRGEAPIAFQLLVYPMLDDRTALRPAPPRPELLTWNQASNRYGWESYLGQPCGLDQVAPYAVPARREDLTGLPPAWIGVGTLDLFYEEDLAYAQRLKDSGVECELTILPGTFHGFDVLDQNSAVVQDFRMVEIEALKKHLFSPSDQAG